MAAMPTCPAAGLCPERPGQGREEVPEGGNHGRGEALPDRASEGADSLVPLPLEADSEPVGHGHAAAAPRKLSAKEADSFFLDRQRIRLPSQKGRWQRKSPPTRE